MLRWSLRLGKVFGIEILVHFTFALLVAYIGWWGWDLAGGRGMVWSICVLLAFFFCVLLHELGHTLAARRFGIRVPRIRLLPIGGMAEFETIPREPSREFVITIAGPLVNFVIAGLLWLVPTQPVDWESAESLLSVPGFLEQVLFANLVMGCFNLLPVFPMDGGRLLRALLATRLRYVRATFWAATVAKVLALGGIALALYFGLYLLAVLFSFILVVGELEYRSVRRREVEEAYWREHAARMALISRAAEEYLGEQPRQ
jgi:Zn-dependent protease